MAAFAEREDGMPADGSDKPLDKVYLVDGSGYIYRAYHALPPMTRPDGTPVNAVYGFTNMLMKLLEEVAPDHMAVVFDAKRENFRQQLYPDYKANRPEPPDDLKPQFPLIREAARAFNLACLEMEGYEADDLIATLAKQARQRGAEVVVVSSDKDLMQLIGDGVSLLDPLKYAPVGPEAVEKKFGVGPDRVVDVQALLGDASDNVPGVPGIGVKTAAKLIDAYGDLETLLARAPEIRQQKRRETLLEHADQARLSRDLVTLRDDAPLETAFADLAVTGPEPETLRGFLKENAFQSILARVEADLAAEGEAAPQAAERAPDDVVYDLVRDTATLDAWIDAAREAGVVAVDVETDSLDAMRANLVGLSLSTRAGRAAYVPVGHTAPAVQGNLALGDQPDGDAPDQMDRDTVLARLGPLLADASVLKVGQNIKYDMLVLRRHGVAVTPIDDTMLLSYVLEAGLHGHGMDELARVHLGVDATPYKTVVGSGRQQVTFDRVPLEKARDYAAEDADITGRLHRLLKPRLANEHMATVYETLERPLVPVLVAMEQAGIKADAAVLRGLSADFGERLAALEQEIHQLAGREFNIGSPKQLGEVLFEDMGLEGGRKGKSGAYSTNAEVLERLAAEGHELPRKVLDWRQIDKLKSTYTDALVDDIHPETGRVHTAFSMAATNTGRLASSDPNMQNIPIRSEAGRRIREAFVAPEGHVLLSADYSQIELRLIAHVAGVQGLVDAFRDGEDVHAATASRVFDVPAERLDGDLRRRAKTINFGIIYGISAYGLAQQLGIPQKDAQGYIDAYLDRFPEIRAYMEATKTFCRDNGFVRTPFGRKVHVPDIKDRNPARRSFSERAAINAPIQGGAADIIKRAMIRLPDALAEAGLDARLLLQVHDELILEVPEAQVKATSDTVHRVMASAAHLTVPLEAEVGTGRSWAEAH